MVRKFDPFEFQRCTVEWAADHLFSSIRGKETVRRFLVADEVGLGKTVVAKHVVEALRKRKPRSKLQIVYMTSNLDISSQNRNTLARNPDNPREICPADRIVLLFAHRHHTPGERVTIYSMTPGTSINIKNSTGNVDERLYIAWLARRMFTFGTKRANQVFALSARWQFSERFSDPAGLGFRRLPGGVGRALRKKWRRIEVDGRQLPDLLRARNVPVRRAEARKLVKKMRTALVEVLLSEFSPDLIILDEFQRFKDLTRLPSPDKRQLHHLFLRPETPTLLLSATPYRPLDDGKTRGIMGHLKDLQDTLSFLYGDENRGRKAIALIQEYGDLLSKLDRNREKEFLELKGKVERALKQVMARTERIAFAEKDAILTTAKYLSENQGTSFTKEQIYEFLALAKASPSRRTLMAYWKSGSKLLSFMDSYHVHGRWLRNAVIKNDGELYADSKNGPLHLKSQYIHEDVFKRGENFSYLWLPATRPYYPGSGLFAPKTLAERNVKKGLVFSSWRFVPRMLAAEVNEQRRLHFKSVPKTKSPLKATPVTWAKLFFPSRFLARALSHQQFVEAGTFENLLRIARSSIREQLRDADVEVKKRGDKPWKVVRYMDWLLNPDEGRRLSRLYSRERSFGNRKTRAMETRYSRAISQFSDKPAVSRATIDSMARMAIASPSVCFLRSLETLHTDTEKHWEDIGLFCIHDIRNYLNRSSTYDAMFTAFRQGRYADRVEAYFSHGNFQAVLDEFLFFVSQGSPTTERCLSVMTAALGSHGGSVQLRLQGRKRKRVATDIAVLFGEAKEQSTARDAVRVGFNSPFWPMLLATTSIGQEGLDFHFYCKDLYHWNLPATPVHFEQREGRINRYCNLMIRKNLVRQRTPALAPGDLLWQKLLDESSSQCARNDRYNLGLSPYWVYTPLGSQNRETFVRHILDLPGSHDRARYEGLLRELNLYRLALGQPDQKLFLEELSSSKYLSQIDTRGLILNLFPYERRKRGELLSRIAADPRRIRQLLLDAGDYVRELDGHQHRKRILKYISQHRAVVEAHLPRAGTADPVRLPKRARTSLAALHYFVDPHDRNNDRHPGVGLDDDQKVLQGRR